MGKVLSYKIYIDYQKFMSKICQLSKTNLKCLKDFLGKVNEKLKWSVQHNILPMKNGNSLNNQYGISILFHM